MNTMKGYKFLNGYGATVHDGKDTVYPLPQPGEKWGPWFRHPEPGQPDGKDCGPGGWHVMKRLSANYAPVHWWAWYAEGRELLGESKDKFRCVEIRLRRIPRKVFWRMIRLGMCKGADLRGAYLRCADLRCADLTGADLRGAYLTGADLTGAYLRGADLRGADLTGAYLRGADLRCADLTGADLTGAYLRGADLRGADLRGELRIYAKEQGAIV